MEKMMLHFIDSDLLYIYRCPLRQVWLYIYLVREWLGLKKIMWRSLNSDSHQFHQYQQN